jgi:glycerate kinase
MAPLDGVDAPMLDVVHVQQSSEAAFEELKRILELKFQEMNFSLTSGISEIKTDLQQQIQTIVVTMPASGAQGGLTVSIATFFTI